MRAAAVALISALTAGSVLAHPHGEVDQQVTLSLLPGRVVIEAVIMPSAPDGVAIYAQLDRDGDGAVSGFEATDFGAELLAATHLSAGGAALALSTPEVTIAERDRVETGLGQIIWRAEAELPSRLERLDFTIDYGAFSHNWFVQPFYASEIVAMGVPELERSGDGATVTLRWPGN